MTLRDVIFFILDDSYITVHTRSLEPRLNKVHRVISDRIWRLGRRGYFSFTILIITKHKRYLDVICIYLIIL